MPAGLVSKECVCSVIPVNIYLFKVNNGNTRERCKICSKLTIEVNTRGYFTPCSSVSTVDFEQVNVSWDSRRWHL